MTGLRWSIETVSVLEPICKIIKLILAIGNPLGTMVQLGERLDRGILTNKQEPKHRGIEWAPKQGSGEPLALSSWVWKSGADKVRAA